MDRIEPETEIHRSQKALKQILGQPDVSSEILFPESRVSIQISDEVIHQPGAQLALVMMVNLLARMKAIVREVSVKLPYGIGLHTAVPLAGNDLRAGLENLVASLTGPKSIHSVRFAFDQNTNHPTIALAFAGTTGVSGTVAQITIGFDSWSAFINPQSNHSDWSTNIPIGPHLAATLGVAEIFKHLLLINFPSQIQRKISLLDDQTFNAIDYSAKPGPSMNWDFREGIDLRRVAIAGLGAGGSAALYTLSCFPQLTGDLTLIDPGRHKPSNLARYLLSDYEDCENGTSKVNVAHQFISKLQPALEVRSHEMGYADVRDRDFQLIVSTVDTPEARWDIQKDFPPAILDAAVLETIYAILRVYLGKGMCLGCKHPYDPNATWKRRAKIWGITVEESQRMYNLRIPVTEGDLLRLAEVQGQPVEEFAGLLGIPFDQIPSMTECGQSHFNLQFPNQVASLPFVTTMAGVLLAAEVVKDRCSPQHALHNWFEHDLLWFPKFERYRFRPPVSTCRFCSGL